MLLTTSFICRTADQEWEESRALLVNDKTTKIVVRDLIPHTPYQIQVIAKNAIGNSTPSSPSSIFITKPEGMCSFQIYSHIILVTRTPTIMILKFQTDWSGQTVQTQIRLLLEEQSDLGLHCLLFHLLLFDEIP